ncbi:Transcription-repair-coupling factor [Listeria fleischmannii subsp. fleischmannii]|uniref:Transcription-repair-coupling factor n=1 Tax=Listeria fleischmannii subsp. fleischmannii TaxID=1671902 RepID=A0A2X3HCV6_9LIST|nr:Transcription-repair-coupling factor [Listeria fleischmannii subsp. fleischmannii]
MTATPIPRTLHMSMLGVRDLSVIETPPANRFPVQTYVTEQNNVLIREAIERELARDGQVYYLYNRVESILQKADEISMLVPDARVAVAHGQMTESELESVILSFLEGEYDVLVTTTIIETGVDIPNVNTLFVQNADHMGFHSSINCVVVWDVGIESPMLILCIKKIKYYVRKRRRGFRLSRSLRSLVLDLKLRCAIYRFAERVIF